MNPEVSIIIPTYNSEAYIAQAIESVLAQTYSNFEIVLVDDASTDSTVEIVRNFQDKRIKIICNQQNRGVSYGRNCGVNAAIGKWIALLDSDDWYAPQRLEKLLLAAQQTNADLVADNLNLIGERESQPWSTFLQENEQEISSVKLINAAEFVISDRPNPINAKRNWSFGYTKPLMKRRFLLKHNLKYDETINVGEDYVLYLECLRQQARFAFVPQAYYYYRTRVTSLSTRKPTDYLSDSCDITKLFLAREASSPSSPQLRTVLLGNLTIYQERLAYYQVLEAIKQKRLIKTIKRIYANPFTLKFLFSKLFSFMQNKLKSAFSSTKPERSNFSVASIKE